MKTVSYSPSQYTTIIQQIWIKNPPGSPTQAELHGTQRVTGWDSPSRAGDLSGRAEYNTWQRAARTAQNTSFCPGKPPPPGLAERAGKTAKHPAGPGMWYLLYPVTLRCGGAVRAYQGIAKAVATEEKQKCGKKNKT